MSTFLVIGGSSGIGFQVVNDLAESGHIVYASYCNKQVNITNPSVRYFQLNVLDENLIFDQLPEAIDGIVYCPGNVNLKPFSRIQPSEFSSDFNLQVLGAIKVIQAVLPKLKAAESASIVLFSTVAVKIGLSFHSLVSTSKGAIEGLTKALSAEFAPKIRVNCVAPSLTDTPLVEGLLNTEQKIEANAQRHPLKRIGNVKDISSVVTFLLSGHSSWITGQVFHVDGGMSSIK